MSPSIPPECSSAYIRLAVIPALETRTPLAPGSASALEAWRARPGEVLTTVDPAGCAYRSRLVKEEDGWCAVPFETLRRFPESPVELTVLQALPERERFELVLQKLTELGVNRIIPFECERSTTLVQRDRGQRKSHRWPDVVCRAAKQCRRAQLPRLDPVTSWSEALAGCRADVRLLLWEACADGASFERALSRPGVRRVELLVGPEGGLSAAEVEQARTAGFVPISLGSRILRTETAAIVATAMLQHRLGDLGREVE